MATDLDRRVMEAARKTNTLLDEIAKMVQQCEALQRILALQQSELDDLVAELQGRPKATAH